MHRNVLGLLLCLYTVAQLAGCRSRPENFLDEPLDRYQTFALQIEYPDQAEPPREDLAGSPPPFGMRREDPKEFWHLSLEEAVRIALANSEVMRDLGGRLLNTPATATTVYDVAIQESNPQTGPEAALSAFDAQLSSNLIFNRNERTLNNAFFGGGVVSLAQNTANFDLQVSKVGATGTQFAMRNFILYDRNNAVANRFPSAYEAILEGEIRQPLLQGAGVAFNRIAGPQFNPVPGRPVQPGNYNGVLIARVRTDVALADFERAVRDLLVELEQTYWQLYFSYRNLDAAIARREAALQTWRSVNSRFEAGIAKREEEALARAEFYAARANVENALSGSTTSGLTVGTTAGVYTVERQLRLLMGIPINDGRLIRTADEPATVDVNFSWDSSVLTALVRRVELRRQRWEIERREMELFAARNFLQMRLDFVGLYRWRGFGDELLSERGGPNGSAFADLFGGDLQEWQLGLTLNTPVGNRIGHTAVRNAEWLLARERAVLRDQELTVLHDLSAAFAELERAYQTSRSFYNRRIATLERLDSVRAEYEAGEVLLEQLLDAQRQATETDSEYFRSLVEYNIAVLNLHRIRGTVLNYLGVALAEGPWTPEAYNSAGKLSRRFYKPPINYAISVPGYVSRGAYPQIVEEVQPLPDAEGEEIAPQQEPDQRQPLPKPPEQHKLLPPQGKAEPAPEAKP